MPFAWHESRRFSDASCILLAIVHGWEICGDIRARAGNIDGLQEKPQIGLEVNNGTL